MLKFRSIKITGILFFCFCLILGKTELSFAQKGNPFELVPRLAQPSVEVGEQEKTQKTSTGNPFDIISGDQKIKATEDEGSKIATPPVGETGDESEPKIDKEKVKYRQFLFLTILVLLILLTLIFTIFRTVIGHSYRAFMNDNLLNQLHRNEAGIASFPFQVLYLLFFVNAGTFVFLVTKYFGITVFPKHLFALLICIGGIAVIYFIKHLLLKLTALIFQVKKEIGTYSFTIIIFNIIIGIALVPFIILIAYGSEMLVPIAIYAAFGLLLAAYLFRSLRGLFIASRFIAFHKFHFLLYICTVEIAPLLILLKLLFSKGAGLGIT